MCTSILASDYECWGYHLSSIHCPIYTRTLDTTSAITSGPLPFNLHSFGLAASFSTSSSSSIIPASHSASFCEMAGGADSRRIKDGRRLEVGRSSPYWRARRRDFRGRVEVDAADAIDTRDALLSVRIKAIGRRAWRSKFLFKHTITIFRSKQTNIYLFYSIIVTIFARCSHKPRSVDNQDTQATEGEVVEKGGGRETS